VLNITLFSVLFLFYTFLCFAKTKIFAEILVFCEIGGKPIGLHVRACQRILSHDLMVDCLIRFVPVHSLEYCIPCNKTEQRRSRFLSVVDPDPYWEHGSGSRSMEIDKIN
jgi:hypothetical protein